MKMLVISAALTILCGVLAAAEECSSSVDFQFRTIDRLSEIEQRLNKVSLEQQILTRKLSEKLGGVEECEEDVRQCQAGWTRFEDSCYLFGEDSITFTRAKDFCEGYGASLVCIETRKENMFLRRELMQKKDTPNHWIGMTDQVKEGKWTYLNTTEVAFTDWGRYQPNNGRVSNCAAFWETFGYFWVDEPCTNSFNAICERGTQTFM